MTKDSTCDVPSGARTVSSGAGGDRGPEGTRVTRAEEKLCCRAVRRKRKRAAESKKALTPGPCLLPHLHPALSEGETVLKIVGRPQAGLGGVSRLRIQGGSFSFTAGGP